MEHTTNDHFIQRYFTSLPAEFRWQRTPLQIYPLERLSNHLIYPTPLLRADYHHLVYLREGCYEQQVGIEKYEMQAPSLLYVSAGQAFSLRSIGGSLSGYFLLMDQKVISRINKEVDRATLIAMKNVFFLEKKDSQWLDKIFDLLYEELSTDKPSRNIGNGLLQAILHKMLKLSEGQQAKISRSYQIASQFQGLVEQHLHEQQSVEFYANTLSVSGNYLNRCVKATYGKNCKNIIQETAILQSQILLFETQKGISEISYEVGFEDPSHFSRVFKKVCGQTPTDFRKIMMHSSS